MYSIRRPLVLWTCWVLAGFLAGCASVTGGNVQKMYVQARSETGTAVSGADCELSNDKGRWQLKAPGDTSIVRSNRPMEVKCSKPGEPQGVLSVESGAAYEYPERVSVVMGRMALMPFLRPQAMAQLSQPAAAPAPAPSAPRTVAAQPAPSLLVMPISLPQPAPLATGYARVDDVDAVPYLSDKGREAYLDWITRPTPRAFAISAEGHWAATWGLRHTDPVAARNPTDRAVAVCQQRSKGVPCKLYAINGSVVWTGKRVD